MIGGVPFLNFLLKRVYKNQRKYSIHEVKDLEHDKYSQRTISVPKSVHIDDLSIQLLLIGSVYLVTYLFIYGVSRLITPLGTFGETVSEMLWGFNFIIGTVIAIGLRFFMDKMRVKRVIRINYADNYLLQRISAGAFDFMITASMAAISVTVLSDYLVPILVLTTAGGLFTMVYTYFIGRLIYEKEQLEHIIALYGMWTGTITTGIALLREIDPYSKTNVPENLVLGSGYAIFVGFPLMLILGLPLQGYKLNQPVYYLWTFSDGGGNAYNDAYYYGIPSQTKRAVPGNRNKRGFSASSSSTTVFFGLLYLKSDLFFLISVSSSGIDIILQLPSKQRLRR